MGRSIIQIYSLTVCFASLMCLVVTLGLASYDVVRITAPGFSVQDYMYWQTDDQFLIYYPDKKDLPEPERAVLRENYRRTALENERHAALQGLTFRAIIIGIDIVIFGVHWRIANRAEVRSSPAAQPHSW
jgi:hypothetical protein